MSRNYYGAYTKHSERMVELAVKWLEEYFSDGVPRRPGDLEDDFCGQWSINLNPWMQTPFYPALAVLAHEGKIIYGLDDKSPPESLQYGDFWYAIPGKLPACCTEIHD
jgi:hypothetical protein